MLLRFSIVFFLLSVFNVLLFRFVNPPVTWLMLKRHFENHLPIKQKWESFDNISPNFALAVICSEDQNFKDHWGFDFKAIDKAIVHNEESRHKRGASTISQQTAKNVFLWPSRTWVRKGCGAYYTILEEMLWSKKRILEVYMNVVELGHGIYGVEAASEAYFHKPASRLTAEEAALLAASLPNPWRFSARHPSAYMYKRAAWIMRQMHNLGGVAYLKELDN